MGDAPEPAEQSRRILSVGRATAIAGGLLLLAAHTLNVIVLDADIVQFDASAEQTVFTWATASATFAGAFAAALHAFARAAEGLLYAATAALLAFFSLDETVEIHERLGDGLEDALGAPSYVGGRGWILVYAPLLAGAAAVLWLVLERTPEPSRRHALAGLALLFVSVVLEAAGVATNRLLEGGTATPHRVRAGFEEAAELSGWILLTTALTASLFSRLGGVRGASGTG